MGCGPSAPLPAPAAAPLPRVLASLDTPGSPPQLAPSPTPASEAGTAVTSASGNPQSLASASSAAAAPPAALLERCRHLLAPWVVALRLAAAAKGEGQRQAAVDADLELARRDSSAVAAAAAALSEGALQECIQQLLGAQLDSRKLIFDLQAESDSLRGQLEEFAKASRALSQPSSPSATEQLLGLREQLAAAEARADRAEAALAAREQQQQQLSATQQQAVQPPPLARTQSAGAGAGAVVVASLQAPSSGSSSSSTSTSSSSSSGGGGPVSQRMAAAAASAAATATAAAAAAAASCAVPPPPPPPLHPPPLLTPAPKQQQSTVPLSSATRAGEVPESPAMPWSSRLAQAKALEEEHR